MFPHILYLIVKWRSLISFTPEDGAASELIGWEAVVWTFCRREKPVSLQRIESPFLNFSYRNLYRLNCTCSSHKHVFLTLTDVFSGAHRGVHVTLLTCLCSRLCKHYSKLREKFKWDWLWSMYGKCYRTLHWFISRVTASKAVDIPSTRKVRSGRETWWFLN
jgi:hypothetical protein